MTIFFITPFDLADKVCISVWNLIWRKIQNWHLKHCTVLNVRFTMCIGIYIYKLKIARPWFFKSETSINGETMPKHIQRLKSLKISHNVYFVSMKTLYAERKFNNLILDKPFDSVGGCCFWKMPKWVKVGKDFLSFCPMIDLF